MDNYGPFVMRRSDKKILGKRNNKRKKKINNEERWRKIFETIFKFPYVRPLWLMNRRLDFCLNEMVFPDSLKLAFEFDGIKH